MADTLDQITKDMLQDVSDINTKEVEKITIKKDLPPNMKSSKEQIIKDGHYNERGKDKVLQNDAGIISLKSNGVINLSSGINSHIQIDPNGDIAASSERISIKADDYCLSARDIIVNNHKLNNKLYELADFRQILNGYDTTPQVAGGLTMLGTVLVRAWEPNLQRYVMVRRQVNIPIFSPSLGTYKALEGLKISNKSSEIEEILSGLDLSGISSYAQLANKLQEQRIQAVLAQETATAEKNAKIKEENAAKQATSMTTLTGQDPTQFGSVSGTYNASPQAISDQAKQAAEKENAQEKAPGDIKGWNDVDGCPNDPNAYWYHVHCKKHFFDICKGKLPVKSYVCNYSYKGCNANKVKGDDMTPLGVFTIATVENVKGYKAMPGTKYPNQSGAFGPWYMELDLGGSLGRSCGIAIHGDFDSEDRNEKVLLTDSPRGQEPKPGEGSTHGCIRLSNKSVTELATQYAKIGQYIWIEEN